VDIAMLLPYTVPTDRANFLAWCERVEEGRFASIGAGDRLTYDNVDQTVALAIAAALTKTVKVHAFIKVLPMADVAVAAKQFKSIDLISEGRFSLGIGAGWREEDFEVLGREFGNRSRRLDGQIVELKRLLAGGDASDRTGPIGPDAPQKKGPPLLSSAAGPKTRARAVRWADGYAGFTINADLAELSEAHAGFMTAWDEAGRSEKPQMMTSIYFSIGPESDRELRSATHRYAGGRSDTDTVVSAGDETAWPELVELSSPDRLKGAITNAAEAGYDELMLCPCTSDLAEADRVEKVLEELGYGG
jgi:alkanesulfonate monooxygenase SsuD/methylene tetrahydromethanopterin reductase-like flavin-dependent oxidoreductase (luciferase family)